MSELVIHGIRTCATCRKALAWAEATGLGARLHDYRKDGLDEDLLSRLVTAFGAEALLNRKGTTWRQMEEGERARAEADPGAAMLARPTLIKRPAMALDGRFVALGFDDAARAEVLAARGTA